ncbi:hypothetical protein AAW51_1327 [Caldimonas brevitalea]|uniref:Uncharacterized protein n=1 Tax=Caldimonas brevitalea TaxID=413882 RepID=A0A0G3BJ45_9BURK|nr:hypothetical protein AAW51_1327 [Caldimonas brevitalea]
MRLVCETAGRRGLRQRAAVAQQGLGVRDAGQPGVLPRRLPQAAAKQPVQMFT